MSRQIRSIFGILLAAALTISFSAAAFAEPGGMTEIGSAPGSSYTSAGDQTGSFAPGPVDNGAPAGIEIGGAQTAPSAGAVSGNPYAGINLSASDRDALQQMVYWCSAKYNLPQECNKAMVELVLNRVLNGQQNTVTAAVMEPSAFVVSQKHHSELIPEATLSRIDAAINEVLASGNTVVPDTRYIYYNTKLQSDFDGAVWIGKMKNGEPLIGYGMFVGRPFC